MLTLLTLSMFLARYYSGSIEYDEIGVVERIESNTNETNNATLDQQELLRRRLLPGGLSNQDKLTLLNAHNYYRNLTASGRTYRQPAATNMNELIWDPALAQLAQDYSAQCNWGHNSNRVSNLLNYQNVASFDYTNQAVGENLFITTGTESLSVLLRGIQYWYDEYTYYTFGTTAGTSQCQSGFQCGHYTQLVWGNTRYVGCGYTKCPTTKGLSMQNAMLLVCNYYFPGNVVGYSPYKTGTPMSDCASDRSPTGNMCCGCPNRAWDSYCCEYCSAQSCANARSSNSLNPPSSCSNGLGTSITSESRSAGSSKNSPPPTSRPTPPTPRPTNVVTPSPTSSTTSRSNSNGCCKVNNSRYTAFCSSIQSADLCEVYSIICAWDDSC